MKATSRTRFAMLAVAVLAGGLAFFSRVPKRERPDAQARLQTEPADAGAELADYSRLTVTAKGGTTELVRQEDGGWRVTGPVDAAGDGEAVSALLQELRHGRFKSKVWGSPSRADLAKWGLAAPQFRVQASSSTAGAAPLALNGGFENPYDGSYYVQRDGDPAVYAAEGGTRFALERTPFDLREKRILSVDARRVLKIEVNTRAGKQTLVRRGSAEWDLEVPARERADEATVNRLLASLNALRATDFPTGNEAARDARGLNKPDLRLVLTLRDSVQPIHLTFALNSAAVKPVLFVRVDASSPALLAEVAAPSLSELEGLLEDLRDKSVLHFKADAVHQLRFDFPQGPPLVLTRERSDAGSDDRWELVSPARRPGDALKIAALLWSLENLKSVAQDRAPSRRSSVRGGRRVTLLGWHQEELCRLSLGSSVAGKPEYLEAQADGRVVVLVGERLPHWPSSSGAELAQ